LRPDDSNAARVSRIIELIASGTTPESLIAFEPSAESQQRLEDLIRREKDSNLSDEERSELHHFMELEHILRMAKAKAREVIARGQ
jgi:hypothetical protein